MLDAAQKAKLLFYLGYSILEDDGPAIRGIDSLDTRPQADPIILAELANCDEADTAIRKVKVIAMAIQDGAIELRGHYTLSALQAMGRQAAGRLSSFTNIPIKHDVFTSAAPLGTPAANAIGGSYVPVFGGGGCLPGC